MAQRKPSAPGKRVIIHQVTPPGEWGVNDRQMKRQAFADLVPARDYFAEEQPVEGQESAFKPTDAEITYNTRMREPLFMSLAKCAKPLVRMEEAIAGQALAEIYARSKGLAGAPDGEWVHVDNNVSPIKTPINDSKVDNGRRYLHLCAQIDAGDSRGALQALCVAVANATGPVKWRPIVERVTGERNPVVQGYVVRRALEQVAEAFRTEVYGEWRRD